jgi:hypothetical protein
MQRTWVAAAAAAAMTLAGCGGGTAEPRPAATAAASRPAPDSSPAPDSTSSAAPTTGTGPTSPVPAASTESAEAAGPRVVETGFGAIDQFGLLSVGAVVENGTDQLTLVDVAFSAVSGDGSVLGTTHTNLPLLRARDTVAAVSVLQLEEGAEVARVTADVTRLPGSRPDESAQSRFRAEDVRATATEAGTMRITGEIVSTYEDGLTQVYVPALCRDASGGIVGAGEVFLDSLSAGDRQPFEAVTHGPVRGAAVTCDVLPTVSSMSETML